MKSRQQLSFLPGEPALTPDYGRSSGQGAGQARQMARSEGSQLAGPDVRPVAGKLWRSTGRENGDKA